MTQAELLQRIKERLRELYGSRFRGLVLYGSVARGDSDDESDIDLLCLLEGPVDSREIGLIVDATYPIQLEYLDKMIHIMPVDIADYTAGSYPLCVEVKKEGVPV
ncbi:MAG: nucleotidyltransferase domain-containing protein [bacterium]